MFLGPPVHTLQISKGWGWMFMVPAGDPPMPEHLYYCFDVLWSTSLAPVLLWYLEGQGEKKKDNLRALIAVSPQ